jgi:nucleoside-diphosphate-sugar epimerase
MEVLITGGAGFLGSKLARQLLARGTLAGPSGQAEKISRITLLDQVAAQGFDDPRIAIMTGDAADTAVIAKALTPSVQSVFHLAAVVSGEAESDFDLGMRINLDATRILLEQARKNGNRPRLVFTSSVAVFGGDLPPKVLDTTPATPQGSYGAQKAMCELMVTDYSRKGFVDGRSLRLPTVTVRPGKANKAASSFASGIIREPLNGVVSVCPVPPARPDPRASPGSLAPRVPSVPPAPRARLVPQARLERGLRDQQALRAPPAQAAHPQVRRRRSSLTMRAPSAAAPA